MQVANQRNFAAFHSITKARHPHPSHAFRRARSTHPSLCRRSRAATRSLRIEPHTVIAGGVSHLLAWSLLNVTSGEPAVAVLLVRRCTSKQPQRWGEVQSLVVSLVAATRGVFAICPLEYCFRGRIFGSCGLARQLFIPNPIACALRRCWPKQARFHSDRHAMSPGVPLVAAQYRGHLTVLALVLAFVSLVVVDVRSSNAARRESARGSKAAVGIVLEANSLRRRASSAVIATSSVRSSTSAVTSTQSMQPTGCGRWKCTCGGFSNVFGSFPGMQGRVPRAPEEGGGVDRTELQWWQANNCKTFPTALAADATKDPSVISILSFSNGQPHCDENTLLNAM